MQPNNLPVKSNAKKKSITVKLKQAGQWYTRNVSLTGLVIFIFFIGTFNATGQSTTIYQEDFESYTNSWQQQALTGHWNDWLVVNKTCSYKNGHSLHLVMNPGYGNCKYQRNHKSEVLTYKQIDASGHNNLQLSFTWKC